MAAKEDTKSSKLDIKTMIGIIGLLAMGAGWLGSWYTNKADVGELQKDVAKLELFFVDYKEKTDEAVLSMKLDITSSTSDIKTIKEDIGEIKADVKSLLKR